MTSHWTNDPLTVTTPIRALHINELRRAVDNYRFAIGVARGGWTDDPVKTTTRIRPIHFTELRDAIQVLWNYHNQGPLTAWTVGSAPSTSRQISLRDVTDLRTWTDLTDPPPPTIGVNIDPNNHGFANPSVPVAKAAGFGGVRLTARGNAENQAYISAALSNGLQVVAIVATGDNFNYVPPDTRVVLQINNEPDAPSTYMTPTAYAAEYAKWRNEKPGYTMFTAGFATGDPAYYEQFLNALATNHPDVVLPAAVAIHVYTKDPADVQEFIDGYTSKNPSIPPVITEWNEQARVDWITGFQLAVSNPATGTGAATLWNSWFPWGSSQRPDGSTPGIVNFAGVSGIQCQRLVVDALGGTCPAPPPP